MLYQFIDNKGTFRINKAHLISHLYLPLTNAKGTLLSSISPNLAGDIKRDNDHFLTPPASIEDIKHNLLCRRDFFLFFPHNEKTYRLSFCQRRSVEIGMLYQKLTCVYPEIKVSITNFIPYTLDAEVMWIRVNNSSRKTISFIPTSFIPLYGRSERNLRDHRHVTSLLNRIFLEKYGIILRPTLLFDETGHHLNHTMYFVMGYTTDNTPPVGIFPTLESFCGEEGDILNPEAVTKNLPPYKKKLKSFDGKECCAALRFSPVSLKPAEAIDYIIIMGIADKRKNINSTFRNLDSVKKIEASLEKTKKYWQNLIEHLNFSFPDYTYNNWLKWVTLQPTLRKLFGCSFLPHFDYGKGGRGWRDLWQDALNLIHIEPEETRKLILHNFTGVRIDGSNATIITSKNEFISDRNKISRVWMDHGIWPYLTLKEYIHTSGDLNILLEKIPYYRNHQIKRANEIDYKYVPADHLLRTKDNRVYKGTVLEHLLVENIVPFFNVGKHNIIRLENADWNDGLDMAAEEGESVTFSCMYAHNLGDLASLLEKLEGKLSSVEILEELTVLLDRLRRPINYGKYTEKQKLLLYYLEKTKYTVSGRKKKIPLKNLIKDLREKSQYLKNHIRTQEYLKEGFYNGYYDNKGRRVEGRKNNRTRMMLPSQVFAIMSGVATEEQIKHIFKSIKRYLYDKKLKGFHLNTNFGKVYMDLGRAFGFFYGEKENGAFFNHMNIMLSFALYERGFFKEGEEVLTSIYSMAISERGQIYPMVPEYFNNEGKGLYLYLTGSGSWYTHTILKHVLGIKFNMGTLIVSPHLPASVTSKVEVSFLWRDKKIHLIYELEGKPSRKTIKNAYLNGKNIRCSLDGTLKVTPSLLSSYKSSSLKLRLILG